MCDTFEKLLNDSMVEIIRKYKNIDDSLDNIVDINISEEGSLSLEDSDESDDEFYGDEEENFSFIKQNTIVLKRRKKQIRDIDFDFLYHFLFRADSIDEIVFYLNTVDQL